MDISTREIIPNYSAYANTNLYFLQSWPKSDVKPRDFISRLVSYGMSVVFALMSFD